MNELPHDLFSILDSVDSTNSYAGRAIHAGTAKHGMAWFAREQTAGKGQRGNTWHSGKDEDIILSIFIDPLLTNIKKPFHLSVFIALECRSFFARYLAADVKVKWPNDIYVRDRKAGGILIENIFRGNTWRGAITGIGLNINSEKFETSVTGATSLRLVTNKTYSAERLARELHARIMNRLQAFPDARLLLSEYNKFLFRKNEEVILRSGEESFSGKILFADDDGLLHVKIGNAVREFRFGEVSMVQPFIT